MFQWDHGNMGLAVSSEKPPSTVLFLTACTKPCQAISAAGPRRCHAAERLRLGGHQRGGDQSHGCLTSPSSSRMGQVWACCRPCRPLRTNAVPGVHRLYKLTTRWFNGGFGPVTYTIRNPSQKSTQSSNCYGRLASELVHQCRLLPWHMPHQWQRRSPPSDWHTGHSACR